MKRVLLLSLAAALPLAAELVAAPTAAPTPMAEVTLEDRVGFTLPVPNGYEVDCYKGGDHTTYRLVKGKQAPALEIDSSFTPDVSGGGTSCTAEIAGETVRGHIVPTEGGGSAREFVMAKGVEGARFHVLLPEGPDTALMLEVLKGIRFAEKAKAPKKAPAPADLSTAPVRTFRCRGSFSLPVPETLRVVESRTAESSCFHFIGAGDKTALVIYSGYSPNLQTGGRRVTARIAGQEVAGNTLTGQTETAEGPASIAGLPKEGSEYVLQRGADGAVFHFIVPDGPDKPCVMAMLESMSIKADRVLPEKAREQASAAAANSSRLLKKADDILAGVKDRPSADAAVPALQAVAVDLAEVDKVVNSLVKRYGQGITVALNPAPGSTASASEKEIRRVDEADCYGSESLDAILKSIMGVEPPEE